MFALDSAYPCPPHRLRYAEDMTCSYTSPTTPIACARVSTSSPNNTLTPATSYGILSSPLSTRLTSGSPEPASVRRRAASNPLNKSQDMRRAERRAGFFRRLQGDREDDRWGHRGDQILHLDYLTQRRHWEQVQAQNAPPINNEQLDETAPDREGQDGNSFPDQQQASVAARWIAHSAGHTETNTDEEEIERRLEAEQIELDELVAMHDTVAIENGAPMHHAHTDDDSDDPAMDAIFQELLDNHVMRNVSEGDRDGGGDAMDMSSD